ncbi:MAG: cyclodeaminase/cyclohydrolase family protein, partial [Erysipelotrichaceae bacterium]|nr:cyclodeaminase/cyclohydrolase family protein [Erysipelotrichaceae bacterium]
DEANTYRERLLEIVDEDTEAFNLVSAAFAMKKETEEEKQLRREAIQNGLKQCCVPPLDVMRNVFETLKLAQKLIDSYNTSTASDLGTGIVSLRSALQGAYFNVLINAGSIKDEQYVSEKKTEAETIRNEFELLYDSLYQKILEELTR